MIVSRAWLEDISCVCIGSLSVVTACVDPGAAGGGWRGGGGGTSGISISSSFFNSFDDRTSVPCPCEASEERDRKLLVDFPGGVSLNSVGESSSRKLEDPQSCAGEDCAIGSGGGFIGGGGGTSGISIFSSFSKILSGAPEEL